MNLELEQSRINHEKYRYASFNCFYSALGSYLCSHGVRQEDVRLALDLQWQFFYHELTDYSSEKRIVGEYPFIYDKLLNERLKLLTGYKFYSCMSKQHNLSDVNNDIMEKGQAILFVNKRMLGKILNLEEQDESITTIIVENSCRDGIYRIYRPNFFGVTAHNISREITEDQLQKVRFTAVKGSNLCGNRIVCEKKSEMQEQIKEQIIADILLQVIDDYKTSKKLQVSKHCWYGSYGMDKFAESLGKWKEKYGQEKAFNMLEFSATGLIFVKRQRLIFFNALTELLKDVYVDKNFFDLKEERLRQNILNQWGDVRIYMRLLCYKKSIGGIERVSSYIKSIMKLECEYLETLAPYIKKGIL